MASAARYVELRADAFTVFHKLGLLLAELYEGSEGHDSSERPSLDSILGSFYDTFTALKARHADQNLTVAVLALTKSGKSTLLNALIGANCLPANNVPETARITRITHTLGQAELVDNTAGQNKVISGEDDIKAHLRYLNSETRMRDHMLSDETYLDLKIPIAALKAGNTATAAQDVTIRLLDTPGPNEAGEIALKAQVERLLDSVDAVIYLLDYTKLKTADEAEILQRLKEINPQLMSRLSQRLFFVVNKADMIETSEGLDAEATKQYVADLITHQMQDESFQLKPDQVLLISAQQALLSRLVLQGKADKDIALRFGRLAFGSRAKKFSSQEYRKAAEEMLIDSGLADLEETVLAFLYTHSGSLKMLALMDDIVRMLQQMRNVAAASNAALQHDVAALQQETQDMQSKLKQSLQSFDTVQQEAQAVEGEVVDEVQQRMQRLKEKLFRDVSNVLEPSRQHPPGRWQEAWQKAARFLNRRPGHTEAHQLELQSKLYELHAAISSSIEAEVRDFWQDVEAATNERQRAMFLCINRRLESLSRQIEATVGDVLDLRLEPVTIAMDPPAAQDFHDSLQNLFAQGIRQRTVMRNRQRQQSYTVWEPRFRNGLCRTGQYFVGRPASRRVTEQYEQPIYDLQPQHIKEYFIALVDGTIEASVKYVREYVHAYLSDMLEEARGQIESYGQSFNATMQAALATRQQGEEARSAALQVTTARLTATNRLLKEVAVVQRCAEQLCPGQHPISDVISEFSLDEPECSHAGHAEQDSAFSRHPSLEQIDSTSQAEAVTALLTAPPVELATDEILLPGSSSTAQAWLPHASLAAADSDRVTDARVAPQASMESPLPAAAPQLGSDRQAVAAQESPLPGMMSELQQAMAASFFSNGSDTEEVEGEPLDEQTQLELAMFLSMQDKERSDRQAAEGAEADRSALAQLYPHVLADAAEPEAADAAAAAQVESAATSAADQAASVAESAAASAAAQAESAASTAAAQAESAASAAAAHATAAATSVAAHVGAAARSVDAALNTQAASVRGTVLSLADQLDGWLRLRQGGQAPMLTPFPRGQAARHGASPASSTPGSDSVQQEEAELAVAAQLQSIRGSSSAAASALSRIHSVESDDSSFDLTEAQDPRNMIQHFDRIVGSDDGEDDDECLCECCQPKAAESSRQQEAQHTEVAAGTSSLPIDQFAALSLLDMDGELHHFQNRAEPVCEDEDSPFVVHAIDIEGGAEASADESITSHMDEGMTHDDESTPAIPWHTPIEHLSVDYSTLDPFNDQADVPISYPQVHGSAFTSSMGSDSPIHYPQVQRPIPALVDDQSRYQHAIDPPGLGTPEPPSPRTQMHLMALGSDLFGNDSPMAADEAWQSSAHGAGNVVSAEVSEECSENLPDEDGPAEAPAHVHVDQEHEESASNSRLVALSAEMSHDSDEWELVSSDPDEELT